MMQALRRCWCSQPAGHRVRGPRKPPLFWADSAKPRCHGSHRHFLHSSRIAAQLGLGSGPEKLAAEVGLGCGGSESLRPQRGTEVDSHQGCLPVSSSEAELGASQGLGIRLGQAWGTQLLKTKMLAVYIFCNQDGRGA